MLHYDGVTQPNAVTVQPPAKPLTFLDTFGITKNLGELVDTMVTNLWTIDPVYLFKLY